MKGAVFRQSLGDFTCPVVLGKEKPSFGLHRFKQGLRFVPTDDEGFSLRGDRQRLLYKGRKRSHRFTILGDKSFEYDCILLKEPESNVVTLLLEGAENFDFFRQPDFVKEPFLKGSYAVYKKETLIGEGTGKLCHIHRPLIIDARGRKVWGELSVVGCELRITIPEWWLSEAKYPVVVDPTIGTTTVGSQYLVEYDPPEDPWIHIQIECEIATNRFLVPETIDGLCTAYAYTNEDFGEDAGGRAVIFSEINNKPYSKLTTQENFINFEINSSNPKGWRNGTFRSNGSIANGTYIYFGIAAQFFWFPRFDYGLRSVMWDWNPWYDLPNTTPQTSWGLYESNIKLSMYFTYSTAQNYVRTLTQGVKLIDSRKSVGNYKRTTTQTTTVNSTLNRFETFYRKCVMTVNNSMIIKRLPSFLRKVTEQINVTMNKIEIMSFIRKCTNNVRVNSNTNRFHNVMCKLQDSLKIFDTNSFSVVFLRNVSDNVKALDDFRHLGSFIRGLVVTAESTAETTHTAVYKRIQTDTVQPSGNVLRGLFMFVRIVTGVIFRDYLLRRFLIAKEELVLKSVISREITLESKIN